MKPARQRRKRQKTDVALVSATGAGKSCSDGAENSDFIEQTLAVWQPLTTRHLTREDGRQIAENVAGFFRILQEWDRAECASGRAEKQRQPQRPGAAAIGDAKSKDKALELAPSGQG